MRDFDDEDFEFDDDDLPELDLNDLDFLEDEEDEDKPSKSTEIKKYEEPDFDFDDDDFDALIKTEAIRALDTEENRMVPSKFPLDEDDGDDAQYFDYTEDDFKDTEEKPKKKKKGLVLKIVIGVIVLIMAFAAFLVFTKPGRSILYKIAGSWIANRVNKTINEEENGVSSTPYPTLEDQKPDGPTIFVKEGEEIPEVIVKNTSKYRSEDYVKTYLLFGIEEIGGGANTDAIMLLSINTKDNTLKLTSLLRDTYVDIPGFYSNKINSVYAHGMLIGQTAEERKRNGATLLMNVIEETYDIEITGYLSVNFSSFEKVVDRLGGIDLELGKSEAEYLRTTNYISNPANRTVKAGWNHMNGNQVLGYCRVRKRPNVKGNNNDYGRTQRHRFVIDAIIQQYKSLSLTEMYSVLSDCLAYVMTNLSEDDFSEMIENVVENKIFKVQQARIPYDNLFKDSGKKGKFNGKYNVTWSLILDGHEEENKKKFHEFVFLDGKDTADEAAE